MSKSKKHKFFFSIITPVFNGELFVESYIKSLLNQTFTSWQTIIIDDNSNDDSLNLLKTGFKGDERVSFFKSRENQKKGGYIGPSEARNIGLNNVEGEYICFLDIDDIWLPNKLLIQYKTIKDNPSTLLLFTNYYLSDAKISTLKKKSRFDLLPFKLQILFWNPFPMLTSCIKSDVLKRSSRFKKIHHEDFIFWNDILKNINESNIKKINEYECIYRVHNKSVSFNKIKTLKWNYLCYRKIGHNRIISLLILFIRIIVEMISLINIRIFKSKIKSKQIF